PGAGAAPGGPRQRPATLGPRLRHTPPHHPGARRPGATGPPTARGGPRAGARGPAAARAAAGGAGAPAPRRRALSPPAVAFPLPAPHNDCTSRGPDPDLTTVGDGACRRDPPPSSPPSSSPPRPWPAPPTA